MRAVASVAAFKQATGLEFRIVWQALWDCRAWFDELFEPTDLISIVRPTPFFRLGIRRNLYIPRLPRLPRLLCGYCERMLEYHIPDEEFCCLAEQHEKLYVITCYSHYPYPVETMRSLFRPLPHLQERIGEVTSRFTERSLGVHIRRTDNTRSIENSPLSAFRAAIDKEIDEGRADLIYLATDSEDVKHYMRSAYGSRVIYATSKAERGTLSGMEDAVVELWTLAQAGRIFGSYWSSFSDTAAELFGRPLHIVKNEQ